MKYLLRFIPIFALVLAACTTTNNPVTNIYIVDSTAPTITRFSPDTVWTFQSDTIYGTHFGYFPYDLRLVFDTAQVQSFLYGDDTMLVVPVPEGAQTGLIHITTINGSASSAKPVVVEYTFSPHPINDTLPIGSSFSIPGTGMNHARGFLRLTVAGFPCAIDSIFPNRIVSHVVANALSGAVMLYDSTGGYSVGSLTVTRPSAWNTLSVIWDHLTLLETHCRSGYINGPGNTFDSIWYDTVSYLGQQDVNVSGVPFARTATGLQYGISNPDFGITWDTITQLANVSYEQFTTPQSPMNTPDTLWYWSASSLPALLPVDNDIEFVMPNDEIYYRITQDSTDMQGLVNWQEITSASVLSGSFDLILKR
ncbi:MAG TPA: IPT/TIG domain-containing protein [Candidatus Kapabacteria bacterium]